MTSQASNPPDLETRIGITNDQEERKMSATQNACGAHNCSGCECWQTIDGDDAPSCMNLILWINGTPRNPPCFQYSPKFLEAIRQHRQLTETLGESHTDTMRALILAMELAPPALVDEMVQDLMPPPKNWGVNFPFFCRCEGDFCRDILPVTA
jgi:hypothetical protein